MSNNQNPVSDNIDDVTKKIGNISLNANAREFKPLNVKAPTFVPSFLGKKAAPPNPVATAPTATTQPVSSTGADPASSSAPKVVSLKVDNSTPSPKPKEPTPQAKPKPVPSASPAPTTSSTSSVPAPLKSTKPKSEETKELEKDEEIKLDEHFKEHFNVIFIGHVDAGKSTLGGNILYLTGMVDKRTLEKYERDAKEAGRESWYLSWALDTNSEERAKGITVECGRAFFETPKRRYTILDAPGHKNFVPNMLNGASQADVGVLVISARKGEFETGFDKGGQTREHAILAKTAGVKTLIVVINKMDDPTVKWDKARYDEITSKLTPFLKGAGYSQKGDIIFMPISGFTGAGVKDRVASKDCSWHNGPSLLETLDSMNAVERKINGPLRFPISEKYKDMGTIISGKVESGHVKVNQKVLLMPNKTSCEVTAIYGENDQEVGMAVCGDNVRVRLRGVEEDEVSEGFVLTDTKHPCRSTKSFDAHLVVLDVKNIITAGYSAVLHVHNCTEEVVLTQLLHSVNKKGAISKRPPPFLRKGEHCIARLEATKPICIEKFKEFPQLGRFTLRDEGKTIAIGKITKLIQTTEVNAN
ncbi:translation termination factor GTPase eRF3 [Mycoemilia scoparia]|uniref:Translation termination factor GTPase eRF3 n=1 Tax=Mycoemilia scoparia TaxID=417184 RepID=A0A9W8A980_9FUNG|nr:translation termination factor GTPase eRF3 [Mycoemilia scoparia]